MWSKLLPVKVVQFASLHNSSVIKMEEVDCREDAIADYAVLSTTWVGSVIGPWYIHESAPAAGTFSQRSATLAPL